MGFCASTAIGRAAPNTDCLIGEPRGFLSLAENPRALGLGANWRQFALLVLINALVGSMVGLERTVLPLLAEREFGLASRTAVLSFIVTFGIVKAVTNLFAGSLVDAVGRKKILVVGWVAALPVPFVVMWAPTWTWILVANVLLGINQGLCWSTTVIMKIDLVGPERRGLAMGLNEFAGYIAVGLTALVTGSIASRYGARPEPFYLGIAVASVGLALSLVFVRETLGHVRLEERDHARADPRLRPAGAQLVGRDLFALASWKRPALFSASQAGLVNNLNDGLAWGLLPLFFAGAGLSIARIGVLAAVYPATWGFVQLLTGALSDRVGRKWLIVGGMGVQGVALIWMAITRGYAPWLAAAVALGVGTAMVYPTLLAAVSDVAHPSWRGSAVGVYRFWRDMGYAAGALLAGALADAFGIPLAITAVGGLTVLSGLLVAIRMPETRDAGRGTRDENGGRV